VRGAASAFGTAHPPITTQITQELTHAIVDHAPGQRRRCIRAVDCDSGVIVAVDQSMHARRAPASKPRDLRPTRRTGRLADGRPCPCFFLRRSLAESRGSPRVDHRFRRLWMLARHRFGSLASLTASAALLGTIALLPNCGAQNVVDALQPCDEAKLTGDTAAASVKAFLDSVNALSAAINDINAKFKSACNAMNADLGLPLGADAAAACKTIHDRVNALPAGAVNVSFSGGCTVDASLEANCQAACSGSASCDIAAHCEPGQLYGTCSASCSGKCDVTAPTVTCTGTCYGECDVTAGASCTGECSGSCSGVCNGTCDGAATTGSAAGNCKGTCVGSCDATCTGKCTVSAGATCTGKCSGRCEYTPGSATCTGECHGGCSVAYTAPKCEGKLTCTSDVNCQASCHAQASAHVSCANPTVEVVIEGDPKLAATVIAHGAEFGAAFLALEELAQPFADVANTVGPALKNVSTYTGAEVACVTSGINISAQVKVQIDVSVQAGGTFQAGS
jgi:hypothetical protein